MAQSNQNGSTAAEPQDTGLQLHIPGMEQFKDLKFIQSEVNPADLIVKFPDGTETVFPNYIPLAQAGAPPALTLEDGTIIPGVEIVTLIEGLDYNKIATAAGSGDQGTDGGGAAFTADPSGPLGDDIGHGPYAGGIKIFDAVGFEQRPGIYSEDGDDGPFAVDAYNNNGDNYDASRSGTRYDEMSDTTVDRSAYPGDLTITLETEAPGQNGRRWNNDWDGMRILDLNAGDTITISHDLGAPGAYWIALDTDGDPSNGIQPPPAFTGQPLGWEYLSFSGSGPITHVMHADGLVYVGTGFPNGTPGPGSPVGKYYTQIEIDDNHIINGTGGNDTLTSGGDGDYLNGLAGIDQLNGNGGNDVLVGGAGDDQLSGGAGSDRFVFTDVSDGHDTVGAAGGGRDFDIAAAPGADNDTINLDALFDAIGLHPATREAALNTVDHGTYTKLTITGYSDFSVILDGVTGYTEGALIANGNLVVDQS